MKFILISAVLGACLALGDVLAVQAARGNTLIVRVAEPKQPTRIAAISGNAPAQVLYELPAELSYLDVRYAPDLAWIAAHGVDPRDGRAVFAYRRVDGAPIGVPLSAEAAVVHLTFDEASRHLLYGTAAPDGRFVIGIIRLADGVRRELAGLANANSPFGSGAAAFPIALFGNALYLQAYQPFAPHSSSGGIFSLDLTPYTFAATGTYPILEVRRLLGAGDYTAPIFAPNGRYAAMLYREPENLPANYVPLGAGLNFNAVAVLDLQTGVARRVAAAGLGQGLEHLAWLPNSQTLLFTGGNYGGADRLQAPDIYAVNALTGQVSALGKTFAEGTISDLAICGERLYVVDGNALRSAAFTNFSDVQTHYADASVQLLGCAAR